MDMATGSTWCAGGESCPSQAQQYMEHVLAALLADGSEGPVSARARLVFGAGLEMLQLQFPGTCEASPFAA